MDLTNFFYILGVLYFLVATLFILVLIFVMVRFYLKMKSQLNWLGRKNLSRYLPIVVLFLKLFSQVAKRMGRKS